MFDEVLLGGGGERRLALETRLGRPIANFIEREPGERKHRVYDLQRKKFGGNWVNRKPACGGYNCFGMLFAARRTTIIDDEDTDMQVSDILADDGYRQIAEADAVVGDLVLYRDIMGNLLHAARVTRRRELGALWALSKWNSTAGEDEHHVQHHCWTDRSMYDVELQFWTDRP